MNQNPIPFIILRTAGQNFSKLHRYMPWVDISGWLGFGYISMKTSLITDQLKFCTLWKKIVSDNIAELHAPNWMWFGRIGNYITPNVYAQR